MSLVIPPYLRWRLWLVEHRIPSPKKSKCFLVLVGFCLFPESLIPPVANPVPGSSNWGQWRHFRPLGSSCLAGLSPELSSETVLLPLFWHRAWSWSSWLAPDSPLLISSSWSIGRQLPHSESNHRLFGNGSGGDGGSEEADDGDGSGAGDTDGGVRGDEGRVRMAGWRQSSLFL